MNDWDWELIGGMFMFFFSGIGLGVMIASTIWRARCDYLQRAWNQDVIHMQGEINRLNNYYHMLQLKYDAEAQLAEFGNIKVTVYPHDAISIPF